MKSLGVKKTRELIRETKAFAEKMKNTPPEVMLTELQRQLAAVASELDQAETNFANTSWVEKAKEYNESTVNIRALKDKCRNKTIAVVETLKKMVRHDLQAVDILAEKVMAGVTSFYATNKGRLKGERRLFESDETWKIRCGLIGYHGPTENKCTEALYLTSLRRDLGEYIVEVIPTLPLSVQSATKEIFVSFTSVNDRHVKQASNDRRLLINDRGRKNYMKSQEKYEEARSAFKTAETHPECSKEELKAKKDDMRTKYYKTRKGVLEKSNNGGIEYPTKDECIEEAEKALSLMTVYKFSSM